MKPLRTIKKRQTVSAAVVPGEFPVAIAPLNMAWRIHRGGSLWAACDRTQIVFWTATGQSRVLTIPNWAAPTGGWDFAVSGNTLVVSDSQAPSGPNIIREYSISSWADGLPASLTFVRELTYSTSLGRSTRCVATAAGGIAVTTTRHTKGWNLDVAYRSPDGQWKTHFFEFIPGNVPAHNHEICQLSDGRLYVFLVCDSTGLMHLARLNEQSNDIALVDFNLLYSGASGQLAPDSEFPWLMILPGESNVLLSYQALAGSITACQSAGYWRFCHTAFVDFKLVTPAGGKVSNDGYRVDYQNLYFKFTSVEGQTYIPQAASSLAGPWVNLYCWKTDRTTEPGYTHIGAVNPYFVDGQPMPNVFVRVKVLTYRSDLLWTTPEFVERSYDNAPMVRVDNGNVKYYLRPFNNSICDHDPVQLRELGSESYTLPDYELLAVGHGWVIGQRGQACFLKQIA